MRLFVAAEIPEVAKRHLLELRGRRDWFGFGEWFRAVPRENLHLTLKFLGEVTDDQAAQVAGALTSVEWPAALSLYTEGVAFFPPRGRINVFVAKLGGDVERLRQLHAEIESALEPLGVPRDGRPFSPHVTLLRADRGRPQGGVRQLVAKNPPAPGQPFVVCSFALFQSHLKALGPEYVPLARFGG